MRSLVIILLSCLFTFEAVAEKKKDFRGLFGSYRRDRYTENEGRSTDIGFDLLLSTLLPITPVVKSSEDGTSFNAMNYASSFNVEASIFFTLDYNWELYLNGGYYAYDTRKENSVFQNSALPLFQQFEMDVYPLIAGVKYRFTRDDIVPYVGLGGGLAYVRRKGFYDYNPQFNEEFLTAFTGQAIIGLEFFFTPRAGIRLEAAVTYLKLPARLFDTGGTPGTFPLLQYEANPIAVRYASGLFFLL